jgi:hypothetical protein
MNSAMQDLIGSIGQKSQLYGQMQENLSLYTAAQSGQIKGISPTAITLNTQQISQQMQGVNRQENLASLMLKEENNENRKTVLDLFA